MNRSADEVSSEIRSFCRRCSNGLRKLSGNEECIEYIRGELPKLLLDRELMKDLLRNVGPASSFPDVRRPTLFDNELLLHFETAFSLRLYLWGPGEYTQAHDHNAWGVVGTVSDGYEVINYLREDDGSVEGVAKLVPRERRRLQAGETIFTLPFDAGIHKTGNPTSKTIITLNLYGKPLLRGYINAFDVERNLVNRILPPRHKKEYLASLALQCLETGPC